MSLVKKTMKKMEMNNKIRGGYYTPSEIATFLVRWALNGSEKNQTVLEPSMGDGAFILPLAKELLKRGVSKDKIAKSIYGVELFEQEVTQAKNSLNIEKFNPEKFNFFTGDFFSVSEGVLKDKKFDIVLGNPPFIRYQNFPEEQRKIAFDLLAKNNLHPNKLTNAWLFFLLVSIFHLKENGKLAMVIPAELLQVSYAAETRVFLSNIFHSITIISFKNLTFQGILQEVVLLLCDKSKTSPKGISFLEFSDVSELPPLADLKRPTKFKPIDHNTDKWTQYLLTKKEILLLRKINNSTFAGAI
jgi:adenine-specific DNA-methyltransferase